MYRHEVHGAVGKDAVKGTGQLPVPFEGLCGNTQGTAGGNADLPARDLRHGRFLGELTFPKPLIIYENKETNHPGFYGQGPVRQRWESSAERHVRAAALLQGDIGKSRNKEWQGYEIKGL